MHPLLVYICAQVDPTVSLSLSLSLSHSLCVSHSLTCY